MDEYSKNDENNKYCRNCGSIITNKMECDKCHAKIINKRIQNDKKYIVLIIINIILIAVGIAIDSGTILLVALLLIIATKQNYNKIPIVKFIHDLEVTIVVVFILFIVYTFVSCG